MTRAAEDHDAPVPGGGFGTGLHPEPEGAGRQVRTGRSPGE